jgi:hypothetical protein
MMTGQSEIIILEGMGIVALAAGEIPKPVPTPPPPRKPIVSYHMNTEPYRGRDPLELAGEAVAWLEEQIRLVEA